MAERGRPAQRYRMLDQTGTVVAEGTVNECAEQIDRSVAFIRDVVNFRHSYPEYWAFPIQDNLIQKWDELTEHLRAVYGVPRYNPNREETKK